MWTITRVVEFDLADPKWHVMPEAVVVEEEVEVEEPAAPAPSADLGDLDFDIDEWFQQNYSVEDVAAITAARFMVQGPFLFIPLSKLVVVEEEVEVEEPAAPAPSADLGDLDFDIDEWFQQNYSVEDVAAITAARFMSMWTITRVVEFDLADPKWHVMPEAVVVEEEVEVEEPAAPAPSADLGDLDFDIDEWFQQNYSVEDVAAITAARFM
eukprot:gene26173-11900_t